MNLIDHLSDVFRQQGNDDNGNPNFVAASQTLDASVLIYSSRVDCVHADAFRVMGGFSRGIVDQEGEEGGEDAENENGEPNSEAEDENGVKAKPKAKKVLLN